MTIYGRSARLFRRYGPWTLVVTAATVAAAYGVNQSVPAEYRSEADVLVEARIVTGTTPILPDLDTERAVVLSDVVALTAAQRMGVTKEAMLDDLELEFVPGANVLRFVYSADNRLSAQVRSNALVEAYLQYRNAGADTPITAAAADPSPVHLQLITSPSLPAEPYSRPLLPDLAIGLGAGLLLGAGTALIRARSRGLIRSREDFEQLSGATVLATIGRTRHSPATGLPVMLRNPGSAAAESYRYLRTRLHPSLRTTTTTILVTSPGDRQGRTTVAANLAIALAQAGHSVVLVDADLHHPVLHQTFDVPGEHGLTTLLDGDATVSEVLAGTPVPGLRLLPAGHRTGEHVDLLEGPQLAHVLHAVQQHCDIVVLDSAAVLSASDAIALAALSDQILLVGDFRRTSRTSVRRALAELAEVVDGNVSAVLLNLPKLAGGLTPHARELSPVTPAPTLYGRPASILPIDDEDDTEYEQRYPVPVIYGSSSSSTVYTSAAASDAPEPNAPEPDAPEPDAPATEAAEPDASPAESDPPESSREDEVEPLESEQDSREPAAVQDARS
ncbi:polysaccharide biosynthesis tyrosine autokinase [Actinoplanes sp. GCM10030250]|uniref:polysaccharide biosynthesis tyrosine autokinase n=1 Tax=Actinoplanes sp. GCM10030250 TaxID=3273376 RepID=UPI00361C61A2